MSESKEQNEQKENISFSNQQLKVLILPLIIEQFLAITVGLADSVMVASVGEAAVSSVSLVDSVNVLIFYGFSALATGGAVVCGQFLGQKRAEKAIDSARQLLLFIVLLSAVITGLLYLGKTAVLHGLFGDIEKDVMKYADTNFLIVEASVPFIAVYNAGAALFRVMGNSSVSMRISVFMNIINVCGNAVLIFIFHMGVAGVAVPTLISRIIGASMVVALLLKEKYPIHLKRPFSFRMDRHTVGNILRIGVPSGLETSLFHLGKVLLLSVVSTLGTASIAANAIGNTLATFQILAAQSIGVGMITVVSRCVGARDFKAARFYTKKLMKWAYCSMAVLNAVLFLLLPFIMKLYQVSEEASHYAFIILILHGGLGVILWPLSFTLPQALKAAGDTTYVMVIAVASMWTCRIAAGILFARYMDLGVLGIWYAMFLDWIVRIFFLVSRYRGKKWEEKYIR